MANGPAHRALHAYGRLQKQWPAAQVASTFMTLASELEGRDPNARRGRRRERARPELPPRGPRGGRPRRHESILYLTLPPLDAATGGQGGRLARGALDPCAVRKSPAEPGAEGVFGLPDREVEESLVDFHGVELRPHRGSIAAHRGAAVLSEVAVEGDVVRLPVPRRDQRRVHAERDHSRRSRGRGVWLDTSPTRRFDCRASTVELTKVRTASPSNFADTTSSRGK